MNDKKSFLLYTSYAEQFSLLDMAGRGELITAIFTYVQTGESPELSGAVAMAFSFIKTQLDSNSERYNEIVEKRRTAGQISAQKRADNKKTSTNLTSVDFVEKKMSSSTSVDFVKKNSTNPTDNDNVNDNVNDNDNDNDNVNSESVINNTRVTRVTHAHAREEEKIRFAENVMMTNAEYKALIDKYGEADTKRLIEILDNYKGSKGKRYKSDYRAILSWCVSRLEEDRERQKRNAGADSSYKDFYGEPDLGRLEELTRK